MEEQNENRKLTNAELELQADAAGAGEVKRISYAGLIARRFFRQKSAIAGLIVLAVMVLIAVVGPMVCPYDYTEPDFAAINVPPNAQHWFGTDGGGFDLFAFVAHGLGRSLVIGISYALLTMIIAAVIGTAIAYVRGWGEKIGMWILDMLLVIPSFLLVAMIVRAASGATGWLILILGLTAFGWIGYARTLRTMALSLRERDYVKAAKYMGVHPMRIIVRHLIPNLGSILIIDTVLGVIAGINSETAYSFLGLGATRSTPTPAPRARSTTTLTTTATRSKRRHQWQRRTKTPWPQTRSCATSSLRPTAPRARRPATPS